MKETINEALKLICEAITALYHEEINPPLEISVLKWYEAINKDGRKLLIEKSKKEYELLSFVMYSWRPDVPTLAVYTLASCISKLSGYDHYTCFDESERIIKAYLNRNNNEEKL